MNGIYELTRIEQDMILWLMFWLIALVTTGLLIDYGMFSKIVVTIGLVGIFCLYFVGVFCG